MARVLELARQAYGLTSPNPMVGALVVGDGAILGEAFHRRAGLLHAEPQALELALATGLLEGTSADRLTLYVNLEPCSHQGRTPPCVEAIVRSPVRHVVTSMVDPNPSVSGGGIERLRAAGVAVEVGCREAEAAELNHQFVARQKRRRPFFSLKVALSADGCIAAADRSPVRITGAEARAHAHFLRAGHDAILVGVETVRRDRPRLDRRLYDGPGRVPRRLILDPQLRSEPGWIQPGAEPAVLFCLPQALDSASRAGRTARLESVAEVQVLPGSSAAGFDLEALVQRLESMELWSVLVEGGGWTQRAFFEAGLWDRVYAYRNPVLRLEGLVWEATTIWKSFRAEAIPVQTTTLGSDVLEVHAHPESAWFPGS